MLRARPACGVGGYRGEGGGHGRHTVAGDSGGGEEEVKRSYGFVVAECWFGAVSGGFLAFDEQLDRHGLSYMSYPISYMRIHGPYMRGHSCCHSAWVKPSQAWYDWVREKEGMMPTQEETVDAYCGLCDAPIKSGSLCRRCQSLASRM